MLEVIQFTIGLRGVRRFGSVLIVGAVMSLQGWSVTLLPRSPNLWPANYFGAQRPAQFTGNYGMGQAPERGLHGKRLLGYQ